MSVFIIIGCYKGEDAYPILSQYGVKSTFEKAKKELNIIKNEIIEEYKEEGLNPNQLTFREYDNSLKIIYGNDDYEIYNIEEREIDYE